MTERQAEQLGKVVARARQAKGLSIRELAAQVGVARGWIGGLEQGRFLETSPDRLARVAEALDIEPSRIDRYAKGVVAGGLPGMRTYFRAKYDLTSDEAAQIEAYVNRLRGRRK